MRKEIVICDRCGKEFTPVFLVLQDTPVICDEKIRNKKLYQLRCNDPEKDEIYFCNIDLCSSCYEELVDWFERGKKSE